jgi:hypothetical protein
MRCTERILRRVVDHARRAPSIHNTQPWAWRIVGDDAEPALELWGDDRSRKLPMTDPVGRNLVISCGAAVHHAVVAGLALGLAPRVEHLPVAARPHLRARLAFSPGYHQEGDELYLEAIDERCTDRRRFTSWPVPDDRLVDLARSARQWHACVTPVTDAALRFRTELLVEEALREQSQDEAVIAEEREWVRRGSLRTSHDGLPPGVVPPLAGAPGERRSRFATQLVDAPADPGLAETSDGLLVVWTRGDAPVDWLHAGETLSAMWLQATLTGLSLVPVSQVIEVPGTRRTLGELLLRGNGHAQVLARIGWQEIGRRTLVRTPRRSLDDVLVEAEPVATVP